MLEKAVEYRVCYHTARYLTKEISSHCTYKIYLKGVRDIFKDVYQDLIKNAAARRIFSNNAAAKVLRKAIRLEHSHLYARRLRVTSSQETDILLTGTDFLKLFNFGVRDGVHQIYTYVLLDRAFYFSETGTAFSKDMVSKHAVHANAADAVRYAGEFHVQWRPKDGRGDERRPCRSMGDYEWRLLLDNNSGTYAPQMGMPMDMLKMVLKHNFPDLDVETVEQNSRYHVMYMNRVQNVAGPECTSIENTVGLMSKKEKSELERGQRCDWKSCRIGIGF